MISLYSGTPGSGKSLHIASRIYYGLKRGRPTICNFEVNVKNISKKKELPFIYCENKDLKPSDLIAYSNLYFRKKGKVIEDSILLIIDECQLMFNARSWNQKGREEWLSFFTQHRKYGYEVVLIAQFDGMVDKQIRSLIEYEVKHRKVSNFGIVGKIINIMSFGKLFCAVKIWYPMNERVGSEFFRGNNKLYNIYNTYDFFTDPVKSKKEGSSPS